MALRDEKDPPCPDVLAVTDACGTSALQSWRRKGIYGTTNRKELLLLRLHPHKQLGCAQVCCLHMMHLKECKYSCWRGLFTKLCVLLYNQLNLSTQRPSPVWEPCCVSAWIPPASIFDALTFYSLSTDLLKTISVQRPQIRHRVGLDTGQNVLTSKHTACLLKQKSGCSISLYLKVIEFMKSKRQQTDKLMSNSISSGKATGLIIYGSFYYSDII